MSYNISFKVKVESVDARVIVGNCEANTTWNVRDIITRSTGLEWKNEENNGFVKNVIPHILKGIGELTCHSEKYKKFEPKNGWGSVESTLRFFNDIVNAWNELRIFYPELAEVAEFWIE